MKLKSLLLPGLFLLGAVLSGCEQEKKEIDNVKLASFYLEQGNDKLALQMLAEELRQNANQVEAHRLLGEIFINAEYFPQAEQHYRTALELGCAKGCSEGLIDAYIGQGKADEAAQEMKEHVEDKKSPGSLYRAVMISHLKSGDRQKTIERLQKIDLPKAREQALNLMLEQGRIREVASGYKPEADYSRGEFLAYAKAHFLLKEYAKTEEILIRLGLKPGSRLLTQQKIQAVDLLVKTNLALDKINDAEQIYHNFLKNNEGTSFVTFQNALTNLVNKDYDAAISEIGELAQNNPQNMQVAQVLAIAQFGKQNYRAVIDGLKPFEGELNRQARILLADAYNKTGDPSGAIALLKDDDDSQAKATLARAYMLQRDKKRALAVVEGLQAEQDNPTFNLKLAELWNDLGQYEKVVATFADDENLALKIKYIVANSYLKLKRPRDARRYASQQSDALVSLELHGYIEATDGNLAAAIDRFSELVENNPVKKNYFLLASIHLENNEPARALETIRQGMELDGNNRPMLMLANRLLEQGDSDETYRWLESIKTSNPDYAAIQSMLANHDIGRKEYERAEQRLQPMMKDADNQVLYLMALARRVSSPEQALQLLEQSLEKGFSLQAAGILHRHYLGSGDSAGLRKVNTLIEQSAGLNAATAGLLARGYLVLEQYEKAARLADSMRQRGFEEQADELDGDTLARQGKHGDAARIYAKLLSGKESEALLVKYFTSKIAAGADLKSELGEAEKRLEKAPEMHRLRNFVAIKYIGVDNRVAIRHFEKLAEKFPEDSVLLNNLAWASLDTNPAAALRYSEKAFNALGDNIDILDTYVRALVRNDRASKAREIVQGKLDERPGNDQLQKLMQSLN